MTDMIFSSRLFIVTFLVLLQFIAPLVHAHTSEKILSQGLHIPGLETYSQSTAQGITPSVMAMSCKVSLFCGNLEGQVVGIDAGVSRNATLQRLEKIIADLDVDYFLPPSAPVFKAGVSAVTIIPSTPTAPLVYQLVYSPYSPRAPPVHA